MRLVAGLCPDLLEGAIRVSYPVRSLGDLMNDLSILVSVSCQRHHLWQAHSSPVGDVIHPLSSLSTLPTSPKHVTQRNIVLQGWVTCDMTEVP